MGLFLSMSGVIGVSEESVVDVLRAYAEANKGSLEKAELSTEDGGCLVVAKGATGVTILYPGDFFEWDSASQYLSQRLGKSVFSLHIHDGDLWMYLLYENGMVVDQFNPIPDYWQELDDSVRRSWHGNASEVARRVPGLASDTIMKYLVQWDDEVFESTERKKAYPTDKFYYGDDWQVLDFLSKIGLEYAVNNQGVPQGATYRFYCATAEAS